MERTRAYEELKAQIEGQAIEEIRATPGWKKIEQVFALTNAWEESIREKLSERYRQATAEELRRRFRIVWLGPELAKEAYGWEVDEDDSDLMVE